MSTPTARSLLLPDAELANFAISRSGASVTVRCWKLTCSALGARTGAPIVVRANTVNLLDLLAKVQEHQLAHHWCNARPSDRDWPVCAREPNHRGMHQSADLEWYPGEETLYPRVATQ